MLKRVIVRTVSGEVVHRSRPMSEGSEEMLRAFKVEMQVAAEHNRSRRSSDPGCLRVYIED